MILNSFHVCYCLNAFPCGSPEELKETLRFFGEDVRRALEVTEETPIGVGLWLPAKMAYALESQETLFRELQETLQKYALYCPTLNAFPYGNFHGETVKTHVYRPNWLTSERLRYTQTCLKLLARLNPSGVKGCVSTLPLGYGADLSETDMPLLLKNVEKAAHCAEACGVTLAFEPEPDCRLETASDFKFFYETLDERSRLSVALCHDCAHAHVMNAPLSEGFDAPVGKIHLSAALGFAPQKWKNRGFEPFRDRVYLHQTRIGDTLYPDIPSETQCAALPRAEAVVHCHAPLLEEGDAEIQILSHEASRILSVLQKDPRSWGTPLFEIETYTWSVLPQTLKTRPLNELIAGEWRRTLQHLTRS